MADTVVGGSTGLGLSGGQVSCYNPGQTSWDIKAITRKNDVFSLSLSPDSMLMSGVQVILGRLNFSWGKWGGGGGRGGTKKRVY